MTHPSTETRNANWRNTSHRRWAFRNIGMVWPTASIRCGDRQRPFLPQALRDFDDFRFTAIDGETLDLGRR